MKVTTLKQMLEREEGREYKAYPDPLTQGDPWTIGIGHTGPEVHPDLTWTAAQIDAAYARDEAKVLKECEENFPWFLQLSLPRQAVLASMAFQIGLRGLLKFRGTLKAIGEGRFSLAAAHMQESLWARQTPARAKRIAKQMETGEWQ